uniref:AN1-type domain-containing protein n=1 Tax=Panagrellus redivivus TaxID=6233 RepID=A0A7E4UZU4_PANRE
MSSPNQSRSRPSPGRSPSQNDVRVICVVARSVMEQGDLATVQVRTDSTVRELKMALMNQLGSKAERQSVLYAGKELKDDDKVLAEYGMVADSVIMLAPRMASGIVDRHADSDVIMIVPDFIPATVQSVNELRETIRSMHTLPTNKTAPTPQTDRKTQMWTPEKQMEHELTRNRMKALLNRRKKSRPIVSPKAESSPHLPDAAGGSGSSLADILAAGMPSSGGIDSPKDAPFDSGSICGSIGRSPLGSEPGTPPELKAAKAQAQAAASSSSTTTVEPGDPNAVPVTEKELKLYFNVPETHRQSEMLRRDLYDPPADRIELEKVKKNLQELQKSACGVCRRRLPLSQQSLKCRCGKVFCTRHRNAEIHKCNVDYKLAGRKKLEKEIPKIELGGARKAKNQEH